MTHDELLARIIKLSITPETNVVPSELATGLMAVVKLHRPEEIKLLSGEVADIYCFECEGLSAYPCPTIQAIEKELS